MSTSIRERNNIKVYNYTDSTVCITGRNRGYVLHPSEDGTVPFELLSFDDIAYIDSHSNIFRRGGLRFEPNEEDQIFSELGSSNYKETLISEEDIEDFIFKPTEETQKRILAIRDVPTIERIRGKLIFYKNQDEDGISTSNAKLIEERYAEIVRGKVSTELKPGGGKAEKVSPVAKALNEERAKNKELEDRLAKLEAMIMKSNEASATEEKPKAAKTTSKAKTKA